VRLGDNKHPHYPPRELLDTFARLLVRAGVPLNADARVAAAAAVRPVRGLAVLQALRSLKPPCPLSEHCISPWNLGSWVLAATTPGVIWASETPCRDFETRLRRLVRDLDTGRRGKHELRDRFAAAELHRHFLLTRRGGCPCGGRLHE
jgi:hypothetical protein